LKIGLVIYGSLDILSGGYLYDRRLVENLIARGDEVAIISLPWRAYPLCLLDSYSRNIRDRLLAQDFDILIEDELAHPSLFRINEELRRKRKFPIAGIVHHLRINENHPPAWRPLYRAIERRFLESLDGAICNSQATWQSIEKTMRRRIPVVVAYPAADHLQLEGEREKSQAEEQGLPLRILFVGNVIPRKGLTVLLEALAMIPDKNWNLTAAGSLDFDPAYARFIQDSARRLLPVDKVTFTGRLSDEALQLTFQKNDLLVVPSSYEGFGIVYLEAMRLGLVPVGSTGGGAAEIITPGQDGYLISPGDAAALAEILADLIHNRQKLAYLREHARKRAGAFPTWQESAGTIRDFLVELIQSHSRVQSG
jgi:glycosyltransferase involved in cell wall biosynthesis